jgi:hypothetical protein
MAIDRVVLLKGIPHYIVGEAIIQVPLLDGDSLFTVVVAITKIEPANTISISRCTWIPREEVIGLVSSLDYTKSEWYLGVENGAT